MRWSPADLAEVMAKNPALRISRQNRPRIASKPIPRVLAPERPERQINAKEQGSTAPQNPLPALSFTVRGAPVPKPRQTRRDKWIKRPSVLRYRTWADEARRAHNEAKRRQFPDVRFLGEIRYGRIQAIAFFKMPGSWNSATKARMKGQPHTLRPDADNLLKAIGDSLFSTGDEHLYDLHITKLWDDGNGARTVITLY